MLQISPLKLLDTSYILPKIIFGNNIISHFDINILDPLKLYFNITTTLDDIKLLNWKLIFNNVKDKSIASFKGSIS